MKHSLAATTCALVCAMSMAACQPTLTAPAAKPDVKTKTADAPPVASDAAMPANWQDADGPGVTAIFVEDQGQRVTLECSRTDSPAAATPGNFSITGMWRVGERPPQTPDVALLLNGQAFKASPLWGRSEDRATVTLTLAPSPALLGALITGNGGLHIVAGDWFLEVAAKPDGAVKRFGETCALFTKS